MGIEKSDHVPEGFTRHLDFYNIYCHPDGRVYNDYYGHVIKAEPSDNAYRDTKTFFVGKTGRDHCGGQVGIHRLVAETFLKPRQELLDNPDMKMCVNHIDGNKWNNAIDNLEWVSYRENMLHAIRTGLRTDSHFLYTMNYRTGVVNEYASLGEAAADLKISKAAVLYYLRNCQRYPNKAYKGGLLFRYKLEDFPEKMTDIVEGNVMSKSRIYIARLRDGKLYRYSSRKNLMSDIGTAKDVFERAIRQNRPIDGMYQLKGCSFIPEEQFENKMNEPIIDVTTARVEYKPLKIQKRVKVKDLDTGTYQYYLNSTLFAEKLGLSKGTLQRQVHRTGGYITRRVSGVIKGRYKVEYLEHGDEEGTEQMIETI